MNRIMRSGGIGCLAFGMLAAQAGWSDVVSGRQARGEIRAERNEERQSAMLKHQEQMKTRMQERQQRGRAAMKAAMEETDPYASIRLLHEHFKDEHAAAVKFQDERWEQRMAMTRAMFERNEVPAERQEQILKEMAAGKARMAAEGEHRYDNIVAALDALAAKENLAHADIRVALRNARRARDGADRRPEARGRNRDGGELREGGKAKDRDRDEKRVREGEKNRDELRTREEGKRRQEGRARDADKHENAGRQRKMEP